MPFKSKEQEKAAFGGYLGKEMQEKAPEWAEKTNQKKLPERKAQVEAIKKNINEK